MMSLRLFMQLISCLIFIQIHRLSTGSRILACTPSNSAADLIVRVHLCEMMLLTWSITFLLRLNVFI